MMNEVLARTSSAVEAASAENPSAVEAASATTPSAVDTVSITILYGVDAASAMTPSAVYAASATTPAAGRSMGLSSFKIRGFHLEDDSVESDAAAEAGLDEEDAAF